MSAETTAPPSSAQQDLAARIYVELVGRAFLRVENVAVFKPDSEELAQISLRLAGTFVQAQAAERAASGPKNVGYDIQLSDIGNWEK